jgi:hypothetical protein
VLLLTFPLLADDVVVLRPWDKADVAQQSTTFAARVLEIYSDWARRSHGEARHGIIDQEQRDFEVSRLTSRLPNRTDCCWAVRH